LSLAYRTINNSLFNFLGWLWPIGLSLLATPYIVHHLGKDAYGILALVIAVLGYFALLDLGLSTATVKYIAEYHAVGNQKMLQKVISSNLLIFIVIGIGGGTLLAGVTPFLVNNVLRVPPSLADVAEFAFYIGAVGFLFTMMLGVLTAIPNALQRYDIFQSARHNHRVGHHARHRRIAGRGVLAARSSFVELVPQCTFGGSLRSCGSVSTS